MTHNTINELKNLIQEWSVAQIIGEGAFGEVLLLVKENSYEMLACKVQDTTKTPEAENNVKKENLIHRQLNHKNVIQYLGIRSEGPKYYIILEYAEGGELFDRITPDVGVPELEAKHYYSHLLNGLEYIHSRGVVHRDIKPENLLLDANDVLKIADFGMATLFRFNEKVRRLNTKCGTIPYVAPEVLKTGDYNAEPLDVWSSGVVLVALMTGTLPWDTPEDEDIEFREWHQQRKRPLPWEKLRPSVLSLIQKVLVPNPQERYTISKIKRHPWFRNSSLDTPLPSNRYCLGLSQLSCSDKISSSQPEQPSVLAYLDQDAMFSFSQPTRVDDLFIGSQAFNTQSSQTGQDLFQRLVKRMTRFWVNQEVEEVVPAVLQRLQQMGYQVKRSEHSQLTCTLKDKRNMLLIFKANFLTMQLDKVLVDFRLSRGDGLEFKRHFLTIQRSLLDMITLQPPFLQY